MKYGAGMCVRDDEGKLLRARTEWFMSCPRVHEEEANGLLQAVIEVDCKMVVDGIHSSKKDHTGFGTLG